MTNLDIQNAHVINRIEHAILTYAKSHLGTPKAIALGPMEYASYKYVELPSRQLIHEANPRTPDSISYLDIPIYCGEADGVHILFEDDGMRAFLAWRERNKIAGKYAHLARES